MKVIFKIRLYFFTALLLILTGLWATQSIANPDTDPDSLYKKPIISEDIFNLLLKVNDSATPAQMQTFADELDAFIKKMARKKRRYRSEERFIRYAFYKIHNRYLKHYLQHTDLYELFEEGNYDCITGTAFYTLVFEALDIDYTIRELPYHVYLLVNTQDTGKQLLLESTDNMSGFVDNAEDIAARIDTYKQALHDPASDFYKYSFKIDESISLNELAGLNYFNEAIVHYNQQNLADARELLSVAEELYPSKRMEALHHLIEQVARQQIASRDR